MKETLTLLISADECAELDPEDWIREATVDEIAAVEAAYPGLVFDDLATDDTGRPYFWRTIIRKNAPPKVAKRAACSLRVLRFR